jgi:hypothetical protein
MTLVFYKRGTDFLEEKIVCLQLGLVGLLPGRAVVFYGKHVLDEGKKSRFARTTTLDLSRPAFLTVASVDSANITFWKGSTEDIVSVPVQAVLEDSLNGAFYDTKEWFEWLEQKRLDEERFLKGKLAFSRYENNLMERILTNQTRVITEKQAEELSIKI